MERVDDRTKEQRKTHPIIVAGTDSFMSGWGKAKGGISYAGWACKHEDLPKVEQWVRSRSEMKRVRIVSNDWKPRGTGHTHIYLVGPKHPALS